MGLFRANILSESLSFAQKGIFLALSKGDRHSYTDIPQRGAFPWLPNTSFCRTTDSILDEILMAAINILILRSGSSVLT
jgi:hypothetical protein